MGRDVVIPNTNSRDGHLSSLLCCSFFRAWQEARQAPQVRISFGFFKKKKKNSGKTKVKNAKASSKAKDVVLVQMWEYCDCGKVEPLRTQLAADRIERTKSNFAEGRHEKPVMLLISVLAINLIVCQAESRPVEYDRNRGSYTRHTGGEEVCETGRYSTGMFSRAATKCNNCEMPISQKKSRRSYLPVESFSNTLKFQDRLCCSEFLDYQSFFGTHIVAGVASIFGIMGTIIAIFFAHQDSQQDDLFLLFEKMEANSQSSRRLEGFKRGMNDYGATWPARACTVGEKMRRVKEMNAKNHSSPFSAALIMATLVALNCMGSQGCPAGFETTMTSLQPIEYSCTPCAENYYKAEDGNRSCKVCPSRSHTDGLTGQSACTCYPLFYGGWSGERGGRSSWEGTETVPVLGKPTFFALVLTKPSFASILTRHNAPVASTIILPSYNAQGGPQGKGQVTFDRLQSQYLDAGPRVLNIATNGGLTIVAVVRFTGIPGWSERIIDLGTGPDGNNLNVRRAQNNTNLMVWFCHGGCENHEELTSSGVIVQDVWLTVVVRYRASTKEYWLTVNNATDSAGIASAALTDRTSSLSYLGRSHWKGDAYFNGDIAGVFVVDEYLSTETASDIANAMMRGEDLTEPVPLVCYLCPVHAICWENTSCALRNTTSARLTGHPGDPASLTFQFRCPGGRQIMGNWSRTETGLYTLISCPPGHQLLSWKNDGAAAKQECAPGVWTNTSCPSGYYVSTETTGKEPFKRCVECGKHKECITPPCGIASCTSCASGYYKSAVGTHTCIKCPSNTYREGIHIEGCGCAPGFHGVYGSCSICPYNSYCPGSGKILSCPHGGQSNVGSSRLTDCKCNAGYYLSIPADLDWEQTRYNVFMKLDNVSVGGEAGNWTCTNPCVDTGCVPCGLGTYSNVTGSTTCTACNMHSTTRSLASYSATQCVCMAGYYLHNSVCVSCPGDMMSLFGSVVIQNCSLQCPNHSSAVPGSTLLTSCLCHPGWTGENGQACSACAAGYYKKTNGSTPCEPCLNGTYGSEVARSACTFCPPFSFSPQGSDNQEHCICNLGYQGPDGGPCTNCSPGYTGPLGGPCASCALGKYKQFSGTDFCALCTAGTYSDKHASTACYDCPNNTISLQGQENIMNCSCIAGYTGPDGNECQQCVQGKYKDFVGSSQCPLCPAGKYSDSKGLLICNDCPAGKFGTAEGFTNQGQCLACPKGTYGPQSAASSEANCLKCAGGKYLEVEASNSSDDCQTCVANMYAEAGSTTCTDCPKNSQSPPGSLSAINCTCNTSSGYIQSEPGTTCFDPNVACPLGTYQQENPRQCSICLQGTFANVTGATFCYNCSAGSYNDKTSRSSCESCGKGRYNPSIAAISFSFCAPCVPGKYSNMNEAGNVDNCISCEPGRYSGRSATSYCDECAGGKYSTAVGATNITVCTYCDEGTYSEQGSSTCLICPAGKFSLANSTTCNICPPDTYNPVNMSAKCLNCTLELCALGYYRNRCKAGSVSDAPCLNCTYKKDHTEFLGHGGYLDECPFQCKLPYKEDCSTGVCKLCDPGTYSLEVGNESLCRMCPENSQVCDGTDVVICNTRTYLVMPYYPYSTEKLCEKCPTGVSCPDGTCALNNINITYCQWIGLSAEICEGFFALVLNPPKIRSLQDSTEASDKSSCSGTGSAACTAGIEASHTNTSCVTVCGTVLSGNSNTCARLLALVLEPLVLEPKLGGLPRFASRATRGNAPLPSPFEPNNNVIPPVYNPLGGPQGKGHVTFDRSKEQYLDAGPCTWNIDTNGGLTIVAVVRFTGSPGSSERIIDFGNGINTVGIILARYSTSTSLYLEITNAGSSDRIWGNIPNTIQQNTWLTVVVRYRASTKEYVVTVNNAAGLTGTASAAVTDRSYSRTYIGKSAFPDAYFNGEIAGVFVVDECLSTDAISAIADALVRGEDLTSQSCASQLVDTSKPGSTSCTPPSYFASGGLQGNGHLAFDSSKGQCLNGGARTLKIASNGGLTIVAQVRFGASTGGGSVNLARSCGQNKDTHCPTKQSSVLVGGDPWKANDGDPNSDWSGLSCTSTDPSGGGNAWWRIDFQRQVKVTNLRITGRTDCCWDRLQGFYVYVGNSSMPYGNSVCAANQTANTATNPTLEVTCKRPITGTYLHIYLPRPKHLTLCEVEIWESPMEKLMDFTNAVPGAIGDNIIIERSGNTLRFTVYVGTSKTCEVSGLSPELQNVWRTVLARYDASSLSVEIWVNNELVANSNCSAALTDRTLYTTYVGMSSLFEIPNTVDDNIFNDIILKADIAGVFVVDEYLSNAAVLALQDAMMQGKDLTDESQRVIQPSCVPNLQEMVGVQTSLQSTEISVGDWIRQGKYGYFYLDICPNGYSTLSKEKAGKRELMRCKKCQNVINYILDSRNDCQRCPLNGLKCYGDNFTVPIVDGSQWSQMVVQDDKTDPPEFIHILKLESCPKGYTIWPPLGPREEWDYQIHGEYQECKVCSEGMECTLDRCFNCTICGVGKYKDTPGTNPCRECSSGKYNPKVKSTLESLCLSCPPGADTRGRQGAKSIDDCDCVDNMYMTKSRTGPNGMQCFKCPGSAMCKNGYCALRNFPDLRCEGIGSDLMPAVVGTWIRNPEDMYSLISCPIGHQLINNTGLELQQCFQCPKGKYISRSDDTKYRCYNCPSSLRCPNRGPPVFPESTFKGKLELEGALPSEQMLEQIMYVALSADPNLVAIDGYNLVAVEALQKRRRYQQSFEVPFTVWGTEAYLEMLRLNWDVACCNISKVLRSSQNNATVTARNVALSLHPNAPPPPPPPPDPTTPCVNKSSTVGTNFVAARFLSLTTRPLGEVWEARDGVSFIQACPIGYLLINTTIDTQECFECEEGTYTLDPYVDCEDGVCGNRPCPKCPEGVKCIRPSRTTDRTAHFKPQLVKIGSRIVKWATLKGLSEHLVADLDSFYEIEYDNITGVSSRAYSRGENPMDFVWEYVFECINETQPCDPQQVPNFYLRKCPPGSQLVNTSASVYESIQDFSVEIQKCNPCAPTYYIVDPNSGGKCQDCPKGALCPDGDKFIPVPEGSEWEVVYSGNRFLNAVKRLVTCPPGYYMIRKEAYPLEDQCLKCEANTYLLDRNNFSACLNCPVGATCDGGNDVTASKGFWKQPDNWTDDPIFGNENKFGSQKYESVINISSMNISSISSISSRRHLFDENGEVAPVWKRAMSEFKELWEDLGPRLGLKQAEDLQSLNRRRSSQSSNSTNCQSVTMCPARPRRAIIHQCPPGACDAANKCNLGRVGPACGLCPDGSSYTADGCKKCPLPNDPQMHLLQFLIFGLGSFAAFFGYLLASWLPLMGSITSRLPITVANTIMLILGANPDDSEGESDDDEEEEAAADRAVGDEHENEQGGGQDVAASAPEPDSEAIAENEEPKKSWINKIWVEKIREPLVQNLLKYLRFGQDAAEESAGGQAGTWEQMQEYATAVYTTIAAWVRPAVQFLKEKGGTIINVIKDLASALSKGEVRMQLKILVSYVQVAGTFEGMNVEWPKELTEVTGKIGKVFSGGSRRSSEAGGGMETLGGFSYIDSEMKNYEGEMMGVKVPQVPALPEVTCLWMGIYFETTLILTTAGPMLVSLLAAIPLIVCQLRALCSGWTNERMDAWESLMDGFYNNLLFGAFLIYPMASLNSLQAFNCQKTLGVLNEDFRIECPPILSFLSLYSLVCVILFPFGIPYLFWSLMRSMKLPELARGKRNTAAFSDMVATFIKMNATQECELISELIGAVHDDANEYARRIEGLHRRICQLELDQAEAHTVLESDLFLNRALRKHFQLGDAEEIDFEIFDHLVRKVVSIAHAFTGLESIKTISCEQAQLLLDHPWPGVTGRMKAKQAAKSKIDWISKMSGRAPPIPKEWRSPFGAHYPDPKKKSSYGFYHQNYNPEKKNYMTPQELAAEFDILDTDGTGTLDFYEFSALRCNAGMQTTKLKAIFESLDKDGSGTLDIKEFQQFMLLKTDVQTDDEKLWNNLESNAHGQVDEDDEDSLENFNLLEHKRAKVLAKVEELLAQGVLVVASMTWDALSSDIREKKAINRIGTIFVNYQCNCWYWELTEMLRKFLMVGLLLFLSPGEPAQLGWGFLITIFFLFLHLQQLPFATSDLNNIQAVTQGALALTLFVGIMLQVDGYMKKDMDLAGKGYWGNPISDPMMEMNRKIFSMMAVVVNIVTFVIPLWIVFKNSPFAAAFADPSQIPNLIREKLSMFTKLLQMVSGVVAKIKAKFSKANPEEEENNSKKNVAPELPAPKKLTRPALIGDDETRLQAVLQDDSETTSASSKTLNAEDEAEFRKEMLKGTENVRRTSRKVAKDQAAPQTRLRALADSAKEFDVVSDSLLLLEPLPRQLSLLPNAIFIRTNRLDLLQQHPGPLSQVRNSDTVDSSNSSDDSDLDIAPPARTLASESTGRKRVDASSETTRYAQAPLLLQPPPRQMPAEPNVSAVSATQSNIDDSSQSSDDHPSPLSQVRNSDTADSSNSSDDSDLDIAPPARTLASESTGRKRVDASSETTRYAQAPLLLQPPPRQMPAEPNVSAVSAIQSDMDDSSQSSDDGDMDIAPPARAPAFVSDVLAHTSSSAKLSDTYYDSDISSHLTTDDRDFDIVAPPPRVPAHAQGTQKLSMSVFGESFGSLYPDPAAGVFPRPT